MPSPNHDEILSNTRLGTLLIQQQQISERQLANALRVHLLTDRRLGDVLIDQGLVPRSVIDYYALEQHRLRDLFDDRDNFYRESSQLGYLLTKIELVAEEVIEEALAEQRRSGAKLGEILVERGHISRATLDDILALQARFRRTAISAMVSLVTSMVAIPHVNSANLTATGQIAITLRFTDRQRPVFLASPERLYRNENVDLELDAEGKIHRVAMQLEGAELRLEIDDAQPRVMRSDSSGELQPLSLDGYELEFNIETKSGQGETMSISLSPT